MPGVARNRRPPPGLPISCSSSRAERLQREFLQARIARVAACEEVGSSRATSTALPAVATEDLAHVGEERVRWEDPSRMATVAMLSPNSAASSQAPAESTVADLHVHHELLSRPAASFFERIDAVIREHGRDRRRYVADRVEAVVGRGKVARSGRRSHSRQSLHRRRGSPPRARGVIE